jgi:hypothetical protein
MEKRLAAKYGTLAGLEAWAFCRNVNFSLY